MKYWLRESNIDVNARNESDISPIQLLTEMTAIVRELIRYGAHCKL